MDSTVQYRCPNCGGDIQYSAEKKGFECEYCMSHFTQAEFEEIFKEVEAEHEKELNNPTTTDFEEHTNLYVCNSCGAEIIADDNTSATFCCYCHNPVALKGRLSGEYKPKRVIPFDITKEQAEKIFKDWVSKKKFTPTDFKSNRTLEKMTGLYVPFWLADCTTKSRITGLAKSEKNLGNNRTEVSEYNIVRELNATFLKVPADGEKKIEDGLMQAIEPFDYSKLKDFSMSYLSGFYADKFDVNKSEVFPNIKQRVSDGVVSIVKNDVSKYTSFEITGKDINFLKTDWEYVLMPVWFLNYKYKEKFYTFVVNGQSGKVAGKLPLSIVKLISFGVILTIVLTMISGLFL